VIFYVVLFSGLAVLLVVAGVTVLSRNRKQLQADKRNEATAARAHRRQRKATRTQSRNARRKRG
jgi:hypothetical protein